MTYVARQRRGQGGKGGAGWLVCLGVSAALVVLLLTHVIKPVLSGILFAAAPVAPEGLSRGFGREGAQSVPPRCAIVRYVVSIEIDNPGRIW